MAGCGNNDRLRGGLSGTACRFFGPVVATAAFGFYGVNGFAGFIGRASTLTSATQGIARRATLGGAMASYLAFVIGWHGNLVLRVPPGIARIRCRCMCSERSTMLGGIVFFFVRSVAILMLYRRHTEADNA